VNQDNMNQNLIEYFSGVDITII